MSLSQNARKRLIIALTSAVVGTEVADAIDLSNLTASGDIHSNGTVPFSANQPMGGFKLTGLAAGSGNGDSVRFEQVIAMVLTGWTSGAGTVSNADSIISALQKIDGNTQGKTVLANVLTGWTSGAGTISNADTVLSALQKVDGNTQGKAVLANVITGFASGASAVLNTDTILQAINKLDGNISAVVPKAIRVSVGFAALNASGSGIALLLGSVIPNKAIITKVYYNIKVAFADNGTAGNANTSLIKAGIEDQSVDTIASAIITGNFDAPGIFDGIETGSAANMKKTTAARQLAVTWTHGSGDSTALTAGSMDVFIEFAQGT